MQYTLGLELTYNCIHGGTIWLSIYSLITFSVEQRQDRTSLPHNYE